MTTKLTLLPNNHPDADSFENYVFGRLPSTAVAVFEEHLLICEGCQHTLTETEEYIQLVKAAGAGYISEHGAGAVPGRRIRGHAAAAAILLLTCLTALLSWRTPMREARVVTLDAFRGTSAPAPAERPLDLKIDLRDVTPAAGYRVEVVDSTGRRIWFGGTPVRLNQGLPEGVYWVRLSTDRGELVREFALRAEKSN